MNTRNLDRALDALDCAPMGYINGEVDVAGRIATIQWMSNALGVSESTVHSTVRELIRRGLVACYTALDPTVGRRRIFVTADAEAIGGNLAADGELEARRRREWAVERDLAKAGRP